ncbi:MAG: hypothetical protein M0P61_08815 [Ignavibacteriaceae bacterium]|jgi:hypothetical protein|nr:hypothetical protein [Ignavibacteriaceae bacterium]
MKNLATIPLLLILFFSGCQKDNSLVPPEQKDSNSMQKPAWVQAAENQGLTLIALPKNSSTSLDKKSTVTSYIKHDEFGRLSINSPYNSTTNNPVSVEASLSVLANSLSQNSSLTMSFDDEYLSIEFGPSGTTFATSALLNVKVTGLNLSALGNQTTAHLNYFDESKNEWTAINADEVTVDVKSGTLICKNGRIPHFSRYGFTN